MNHTSSKSSPNIPESKFKSQPTRDDKKVPISRLSLASIHRKDSSFNGSVDSLSNANNRRVSRQQSFASIGRKASVFNTSIDSISNANNRRISLSKQQSIGNNNRTKSFHDVDEGSENTDSSSLSSSSSITENTEGGEALSEKSLIQEENEDESMQDSTEYFRSLRKNDENELDPWACYLEAIKETTPRCEYEVSMLKMEFEDQTQKFYKKRRPEFIKNLDFDVDERTMEPEFYTTHEAFDQKNERNFKTIFKYAHQQARKLNKRSQTARPAKLDRESYNHKRENKRLDKILDVRHLGLFKNESVSSDEDDENEVDEMKLKLIRNQLEIERYQRESEQFKHNIYGHFAKKYGTKIEQYQNKAHMLRTMYNKAKLNQEQMKDKYLPDNNILERRPVKSAKPNLQSNRSAALDLTSYSTSTILSDKVITERAPVHEQQADVYRNRDQVFRVSLNPVTLDVQVFQKPRDMNGRYAVNSPVARAKSVMAAYSHSNFSTNSTTSNPCYKQMESSRLSQVHQQRPSTSVTRKEFDSRVKKRMSPIVPLGLQDLKVNSNTKTIDAKCLSTMWKKF